MKARIWLIGGTSDSAEIARLLAEQHLPCTITVTTAAAQTLYPQCRWLKVRVGKLESGLEDFLKQEQIGAIVDASHPYAVAISQTAIAAASYCQIPYLRYERPTLAENDLSRELNFDELLCGSYLLAQRVLLTVGCKALPLFAPWQQRATLFARVLPTESSLAAASQAGFTSDRLIALRPPISAELETALWQQWQISLVVTKASGQAGGEDVKRAVAQQLGIPLVVIARPKMFYPQQTDQVMEVLEFCQTVYSR
ncbi:MAG: cobalt-precorrin-6A reductase [Cyanophyceae cyanobacterium]